MAFNWGDLTGPGLIKDAGNSLFPNAANGAQGPINQIPNTISPYYQPYINAGSSALPGYQNIMNQLMSNPSDFINKLGQGYQQSPGYNWNVQQGQQGINAANAAGGMLGTPQHEQQSAQMMSGLASQDYGNYMQRALSAMGVGQQGMAGLIGQGASSSNDLATALAQALMSKSNLQYAGQANQNQQTGGLLGNVIGGIGSIFAGG